MYHPPFTDITYGPWNETPVEKKTHPISWMKEKKSGFSNTIWGGAEINVEQELIELFNLLFADMQLEKLITSNFNSLVHLLGCGEMGASACWVWALQFLALIPPLYCDYWSGLNLPQEHIPYFFFNNQDVKAKCEQDSLCPYKVISFQYEFQDTICFYSNAKRNKHHFF